MEIFFQKNLTQKGKLFVVLLLSAFLFVSVVSANSINSSTMRFQGELTDNGGVYNGTIPAVLGFDIYAKNGSLVQSPVSSLDGGFVGVDHDAFPNWTIDTPDYTFYALNLESNNWELWYLKTEGDPSSGPNSFNGTNYIPFSGTINWTSMFATENGSNWEQNWSWGYENIQLEGYGFNVSITSLGGNNYSLELIPFVDAEENSTTHANSINSSTMRFQGTLTPNGTGYNGTLLAVSGFDLYAKVGSTVQSPVSSLDGGIVGNDHDAYPNWTIDTPDYGFYALNLEESKWELWYLKTEGDPSSGPSSFNGTDYIPLSGTMDWILMFASENNSNWEQQWSWGYENVQLENSGFNVSITSLGGNNYSVELIPFATPESSSVEPAPAPSSTSSGGGGGYCTTSWSCSEWSECVDGIQTRVCNYPPGFCTPTSDKPLETNTCSLEKNETFLNVEGNSSQGERTGTNFLTALVIDGETGKVKPLSIVSILAVLGLGTGAFFSFRKGNFFRKNKSKEE